MSDVRSLSRFSPRIYPSLIIGNMHHPHASVRQRRGTFAPELPPRFFDLKSYYFPLSLAAPRRDVRTSNAIMLRVYSAFPSGQVGIGRFTKSVIEHFISLH
jgi:hypothetical protein